MGTVRHWFAVVALVIGVLPPMVGAQLAGPEFQVNTYTTAYQYDPAVAADATGNFVVVWTGGNSQDGSGTGIFGQRYSSSGTALGGEFQVNTYTTSFQYVPAVAADPAGGFVVVWSGPGVGDGQGVFGQRFDSSGTPLGTEFRVNTYTPSQQSRPAVAADPSGGFVVAWQSRDQEGGFNQDGVYAQRYDSSGTPLGAEFRVNTFTNSNQAYPSIAADSTGGFVVVWESFGQDGSMFSSNSIHGQRYDNTGATLGSEFQVNSYVTGDQREPKVATDTSDGFIVAWRGGGNQDGNGTGVFGQRYDSSGATVGGEFQANTYTTGDQYDVAVAGDTNGGFVVVWNNGGPGDDYGIFGQRYDSSGTPIGSQFRANTYTTSDQYIGSVAPGPDGGFVVVWQSNGQDGSSDGIFAQRLCAETTCMNGDGCCPEGCDNSTDDDCPVTTTTTSTSTTTSTTSTSTSTTSTSTSTTSTSTSTTSTSSSTSSTTSSTTSTTVITTTTTSTTTTTTVAACPNVGGSPSSITLKKTMLKYGLPGKHKFSVTGTFSTPTTFDPSATDTTYVTISDSGAGVLWASGAIAPSTLQWAKSKPLKKSFRYGDSTAAVIPGLQKISIKESPVGSGIYKLSIKGRNTTLASGPPTVGTHTVTMEFSTPLCFKVTAASCVKGTTSEKCI